LNGSMWGIYGLALGIVSISLPNGVGAALSVFNIFVKLSTPSSYANNTDAELTNKLLKQVLEKKHAVFIQSIMAGVCLHVPLVDAQGVHVEMESQEVQVHSSSAGTALHIIQMPGDHVAFRLIDGRWLCMSPGRPITEAPMTVWVPGPFHMVAINCEDPGEAGTFLPVKCGGTGLHHEEHILQTYNAEALGFWNPLYRVFLRIDDNGAFDSSVVVNPIAGEVRMPTGWYRERFELQLVGDNKPGASPMGNASANRT